MVEKKGKKVSGEKICGLSDWRYPSVVLTMRACLLAGCLQAGSFFLQISLRLTVCIRGHCKGGTHDLHRLGVLLSISVWVVLEFDIHMCVCVFDAGGESCIASTQLSRLYYRAHLLLSVPLIKYIPLSSTQSNSYSYSLSFQPPISILPPIPP